MYRELKTRDEGNVFDGRARVGMTQYRERGRINRRGREVRRDEDRKTSRARFGDW